MTIGYFSDEFCQDIRKFANMNRLAAPFFTKLRKNIEGHGVHFQLPRGGYILPPNGDEVSFDTDILRPPYPVTVIEYPEGGSSLRFGETPSTKRLVVAIDEGDSVTLYPAYYQDVNDTWIPPAIYWRFKYGHPFSLSRTKPRDLQDESGMTYGECWPNVMSSMRASITLDEYAGMEIRNINQELSVYMDMCMALDQYETEISEEEPSEEKRKMRKLRGRPPLMTYKIITITGKKREAKEGKGGTHASPVTHLRRGHWRHYKSGKRAWVEAMVVNGKGGIVAKNYKVESRA